MPEEVVVCTYRVKKGNEKKFEALLRKHWPTLRKLKLASAEESVVLKSIGEGGPTYTEIFSWVDEKAAHEAHESPEVMAIWEPMGALVEGREGRPSMEFPHFHKMKGFFK